MAEVALLAFGLVVGALVTWVVATARARAAQAVTGELRKQLEGSREEAVKLQAELRAMAAEKAAADARAGAAQANLEEEKALLLNAQARLSDAFRALAAEALKSSNQDFLALAETRFAALKQEAAGELEARKTAIETLVQPLQQALEAYQNETKALEAMRLEAVATVKQQLGDVVKAQTSLQRETANLVKALRQPQVRGRWGEIHLRRTAELAGMARHCDFVEQESVATDAGRLRPDMVVRLPGRGEIVVDSKVALDAYLEALEAATPEDSEAALIRHAQQVRSHVRQLATKEYRSQFQEAPELTVLFIPGDAFLAAAAERDPDLIQDALSKGISIATPTTLIGLLLTVAKGWQHVQIAENAQQISELGRELHDRMAVLIDHFAKVGKALASSLKAYNDAVGSLETRVLPQARRFGELGVGPTKEVPLLEPLDQAPRAMGGADTTPETT
jgi:DNA recombination protein RmuC